MVFSSYIFIFAFLPIVLIGYYSLSHLKNSIHQRHFLIAASLFFYGYYNVRYLALIIASMVINYVMAKQIQRTKDTPRKLFLTAGVLFNVALIGYFKYYDFFVENVNLVFGSDFALRHILLPLGISFFTFQQLSFLLSVYRREEKVERLRDSMLFVTFFPQLVAGPIVLYSEMIPQCKDESRRFFNPDNFSAGIYLFAIGLFKKVVIADSLAVWVDNGFGMSDLGLIGAWAVSLSYTMQIYFDFSGYSDMAVGLARLFNIEIPFNFLSPYQSVNISDFWRKWHITLGRSLSEYVYKPLGGSRKGLTRTCINLFLTFFVSGLWHGAAWTFVLWGVLHGVFRVADKLAGHHPDRIPRPVRIFITFLIVNALWVLFRAENFSQAMTVYRGMVDFGNMGLSALNTIVYDGVISFPSIANYAFVLVTLPVLMGVVFFGSNSAAMLKKFCHGKRSLWFAAVLFCISVLCLGRNSVFIYFNF